MLIKDINNYVLISVFKIICGIKHRNKFNSICLLKKIKKINSSIKDLMILKGYVKNIFSPDKILPFSILLEWKLINYVESLKMLRGIQTINLPKKDNIIICFSVLNIKTKESFQVI